MKHKRALLLVFATIVTLILAVVAVVTSMKLKQLATVSVAPTAPQSKPLAAQTPANLCETTFTVTEDQQTADARCTAKTAHRDDAAKTPITSTDTVNPGDTFVYTIAYRNTGDAATSADIADTLPAEVDWVSGDTACTAPGSDRVVRCHFASLTTGSTGQVSFKVRVKSSAVSGQIANSAVFTPGQGSATTCSTTVTVARLTCGQACTTDSQCGADESCAAPPGQTGKVCTLSACSGKTDPCDCEGDISCVGKTAFKDDSTNVAGTTYKDTANLALIAGNSINRDQQFVYRITYKNTSTASLSNVVITDVLPVSLTYVDSQDCTLGTDKRTVTCTVGHLAGNAEGKRFIRVKVKADAAEGAVANQATVKNGTDTAQCAISLSIPHTPVCNDTCQTDSQCPSNLKCLSNKCRNAAEPSSTTCVVAPKCDDYCANDSECPSGMKCEGNHCRNSACLGDTDCTCDTTTTSVRPPATPRPTPIPTEMPKAGMPLPGILFIGAGALLVIFGVLAVAL